MQEHYVRVLVPLKLDWIPVYRTELPLKRGDYVNVALSGRKYTGVVWECDALPDISSGRILPVLSAAEGLPAASEREMKFWTFLSEYYLCSLGEVYKAARPAQLLRAWQAELRRMEKAENARLARKDALDSAVARLELRLAALEEKISSPHRSETVVSGLVSRKERILAQLEEKRKAAAALSGQEDIPTTAPAANTERPLVVHGTQRLQTYMEAVTEALDAGGQVLILTPETAFCERLETFFSQRLGSRLHTVGSPARRGRTAIALEQGTGIAVVCTKNGIFLPFSRLSLIIIDEEQDSLYKQNDSAPRYNGRDSALMLAELHSARVLLGSPSPSLETAYNCMNGKFVQLRLPETTGRLSVIDVKAERKKNGMSGYFSRKLVAAIRGCKGKVTLIRGWEKPETLNMEISTLFPENAPEVLSPGELKSRGCDGTRLLAILQADALVDDRSFRCDEKALQLVETLRALVPELIIQTAVSERFDGSKTLESLLAERREFNFPPFSRMVEIRSEADGEARARHFLKRDAQLGRNKRRILADLPRDCYPDVDPA